MCSKACMFWKRRHPDIIYILLIFVFIYNISVHNSKYKSRLCVWYGCLLTWSGLWFQVLRERTTAKYHKLSAPSQKFIVTSINISRIITTLEPPPTHITVTRCRPTHMTSSHNNQDSFTILIFQPRVTGSWVQDLLNTLISVKCNPVTSG